LCRGEVNSVARVEAKRLYPQTTFSAGVTRRSLADELKLNFDVEIGEFARDIRAQGEHGVLDRREFDEQRDLRVLALQATQEFAMPVELHELLGEKHLQRKRGRPHRLSGQRRGPIRFAVVAAHRGASSGAARLPGPPAMPGLEVQCFGQECRIEARVAHTKRHRIRKCAARHHLAHSARGHHNPLPLVHTSWNLSPTVHGGVVNKSESLQRTVHGNTSVLPRWRPRSRPVRRGWKMSWSFKRNTFFPAAVPEQ
jgi:hypothetical protein